MREARAIKSLVLMCAVMIAWSQANPYNNSIELRNDSAGSQYFRFRYRESYEKDPVAYYLQSSGPDTWEVKTSGNRNGVIWGIQARYMSADESVPNTERLLFRNKNILSDAEIRPDLLSVCTRNTEGCNVSLTFGNHQDDWDFVVARKDSILAANGLTDESPDWDKAFAMAYHCYWRRAALPDPPEGGSHFVHPVDFLKYKAFCVAAANGFVALCGVMGIPARTCGMPNHTTAEAFVDGKWRWAENSPNFLGSLGEPQLPDSVEQGPLFSYSLAEMLSDPHRYGFGEIYYYKEPAWYEDPREDTHVEYLLESGSQWRFYLNSAYQPYTGPSKILTLLSAYEIGLLYSGDVTTCRVGPGSDTAMWLVPPYHGKRVWKAYSSAQVGQQNGIRQFFYLSDTTGLTEVKSYLVIDTADAVNMPADGGDWYYSVNGQRYYLRDHGGWSLEPHPYTNAARCLVFSIPSDALVVPEPVARAPESHGISERANRVSYTVVFSKNAVHINVPIDGVYGADLRSLDGRVRARARAEAGTVSFSRSSLAAGLYFVTLREPRGNRVLRMVIP